MKPTLAIANKTYSSWSFRPWILMRHFGIAFDEIVIPMAQSSYGIRSRLSNMSPNSIHAFRSAEAAGGAGAGAFARRRNAFELHRPARAAADEYAPRGEGTRADPRGERRYCPPRTGFWASPQGVR